MLTDDLALISASIYLYTFVYNPLSPSFERLIHSPEKLISISSHHEKLRLLTFGSRFISRTSLFQAYSDSGEQKNTAREHGATESR